MVTVNNFKNYQADCFRHFYRTLLESKSMPFDKEALPYVITFTILVLMASFVGLQRTALVLLLIGLCIAAFFRDPQRAIPSSPNIIVSPADGKVVEIAEHEHFSLAPNQEFTRISIFLSVLNVHINRSPIAGKLTGYGYHPGKFMMAFHPKASLDNEQSHLLITADDGTLIGVKQIAGWIARRIVTRVKVGDTLARGQRFGLIRFGSRVDIFLPPSAQLRVKVGDTVTGARDILAQL